MTTEREDERVRIQARSGLARPERIMSAGDLFGEPVVRDDGMVRAISLWQPWASAIALGHKTVETRGWSTKYRGPLVIHAAKRWTKAEREFAAIERTLGRLPDRLPLGALVCICDLVDVRPSEEVRLCVGAIERLYGNYAPGRFGWILDNVRAFDEPIEWKGRQGFFSVPIAATRPPTTEGE